MAPQVVETPSGKKHIENAAVVVIYLNINGK